MGKEYKISVAICTCDRPKELKRAVDSIFKQTFKPFEVIIVSVNAPNPESLKDYPQLRYVAQKTPGIGAGRKIAVENFNGNFLAFIDDDCMADKDWLRQLYIKQKQENFDVVGGPSLYRDTDEVSFKMHSISRYGHIGDYSQCRRNKKFWHIGLSTGNILIKKDVFEKINFDPYYLYYFEDEDFITRAQLKGFKIGYAKDAIVRHFPSQLGWHRKRLDFVFRNSNYYSVKNFGITFSFLMHRFVNLIKTTRWFLLSKQANKIIPLWKYTLVGIKDGLIRRKQLSIR